MICKRCNKETKGNLVFCPVCGFKTEDNEIIGEQYREGVESKDENKIIEYIVRIKPYLICLLTIGFIITTFIIIKTKSNFINSTIYLILLMVIDIVKPKKITKH